VQITGTEGRYVKLEDTAESFERVANGESDELPEQAFDMVGDVNEVVDKAKKIRS